MKTSLIVPLFNEESRIGRTLPIMAAYATRRWGPLAEIVGVDDGSTDSTALRWAEASRAFRERTPDGQSCHLHLLHHPRNRGKGAAVRTGMQAARGATRIFLDADLASPVTLWGTMDAVLTQANHPEVVIASRWIPGSRFVVPQPLYRQVMSRTFNALLRWQTHLPYRDTQCGAKGFTAASAEALFSPLRNDGFIFDVEVLLRASRAGLFVQEIPVDWMDQRGSTVHAWRDSWQMFRDARRLAHIGEGG